MVSFRSASWVILVILVISYLPLFPGSSGGETATGNLYVTSNSALASSPFVRSGSGSPASPYVISDWDMGSYYIRLDDTTSNVIIRNITFTSSSSWGLYLDNSDNILLDNISSTGRGKFLYSINSQNLMMDDCNVTSIPSETNTMDIRNGASINIRNSRFIAATSATTRIYFNDQGSNQLFFNNYLSGVDMTDDDFWSDGRIINSTFIDSRVSLTDGRQGSAVSGNTFISDGQDLLTLNTCYYLDIGNNYFEGDNGIFFYSGVWQNSNIWGKIHNNTFESCTNGISTRLNWQARPSRYLVTDNYFGNCSTYAIDWGYGMTCRVWKNIFYHNAGTDNTSTGSQCNQYNWGQNVYKIYWTENDQGNFWANHRTPDNDLDGIVDVAYTIATGGSDTHPYTNPYFDTEIPEVEILAPTDLYPDRSYLLLSIRAEDEGSGIRTLELKVDNGLWENIQIGPQIPVFLDEGNHFIHLRATDRAGMMGTTSKQYILGSTFEFLEITSPNDREYRSSDIVDITWDVESYFTPGNQTLTIDGEDLYLDPGLRVYRTQMEEGSHDVFLRIEDNYGLDREKSINFTVDLTDPSVAVISPQDGSTLSNNFVRINYDARDNIGLGKIEIKMDDGDWVERPLLENQFSGLLDDGQHSINIRATDLSGRESLDSISFEIGDNQILRFVSPENGSSYRESLVRLKWEYDGPFDWERSLLRIGKTAELENIYGQKDLNITLDQDGFYDIDLRLVDTFDNFIETSLVLVKDTVDPIVGFVTPNEGLYYNTSIINISWSGIDNIDLPMERYELKVNSDPFMDMGTSLFTELDIGEGEHTIVVKAVDRAGNSGQSSVSIIIDTTPPMAAITDPIDGATVIDSYITLKFSSSDNYGLKQLNLTIDGTRFITVTSKNSYTTTIGQEGEHIIDLIATDMAGNTYVDTISFFLDTMPPVITWIVPPEGVTSNESFYFEWAINEASGLNSLMILVDGAQTDLKVGDRNHTITLPEGDHYISVKAVDSAGLIAELISSVPLTIDRTDPIVQIDELRSKPDGNSATMYWSSEDIGTDIETTMVSLDNGEFIKVFSEGTYNFEGLSIGDHVVTLRVIDKAGNIRDVDWSFSIDLEEGPEDGDEKESDIMPLIIGAFIIFLIFIIIVIFIVVRNRKQREREEIEDRRKKMAKKPKKIEMNIPAAPMSQSLPSDGTMAQDLPPAGPAQKVEETKIGSGYIRPKKEKKKKRASKPRDDIQEEPIEQPPEDMFRADEDPSPEIEQEVQEEDHSKDENVPVPEKEQVKKDDVNWDEDDEEVDEFEELEDLDEYEDLEEIEEMEDLDEIEDWPDEDNIEEWG